jgi:hypothetical protein
MKQERIEKMINKEGENRIMHEKTIYKKIGVIVMVLVFAITFSACGSSKVIDGKEYETYGLLNEDSKKDPNIEYELIVGNTVWGLLLATTVIAPFYFFGFSIFEPVGKKIEGGKIS